MTDDVVIMGAGGHGRETLDVIEAINADTPTWNFLGFLDDDIATSDRVHRRGWRVLGTIDDLPPTARYVIAIGSSVTRAVLDARVQAPARAATLIHPHASVASDNRIGEGVVIAAGAHVTTNVTLGRHVHININAVVSHDSTVGDYATLSPGVCVNGEVEVGDRVFIGTGAILTPGVSIGEDAIIGAGAVVVRDVPAGTTVIGVPAR